MSNSFTLLLLGLVGAAFAMGIVVGGVGQTHQLAYNYYKFSCPNVENIVRHVMLGVFLTDATAPAAFLRLLFHDCQVQVSIHISITLLSSKP